MLFPTSLVGSYPQPEWLIDREKLSKQVPRVRAGDLWLVPPDKLEAAQDDATILAIRDQERAGLDIITDGEMQRVDFNLGFYDYLEGIKPLPQARLWGPPAHDQRIRYLCVGPLSAPQGLGLVREYRRLRRQPIPDRL